MGIGQWLMQIGISQIKHLFFGGFDVQEKACPVLVEKPLPLLRLHHDFVIDLQVQLRSKGLDESSSVPEPMGGKIRCFGGGIEPTLFNPDTLHPFEFAHWSCRIASSQILFSAPKEGFSFSTLDEKRAYPAAAFQCSEK